MKKILFTLLAAVGLTVAARAAEEVSVVTLSSFTNAVPAASTHTNPSSTDIVDLRGWRGLSMQITATGLTGSTSNVVVTLARSVDTVGGTTPGFLASTAVTETIRPSTFTFALNGTNVVRAITNFPATYLDGVSGLKVYSVATGSDAVSNLAIKFLRKRTD